MFERARKEFGDDRSGGVTLAATADVNLFEMHHLVIGATAPNIAGEDIDGVQFKLTDYRGKVVVLDFWGNW